jgi:type I restriction enzyme, S subunit
MVPYLRAANVTWSGLDLSDVKQMDFRPAEQEVYRLRPGDILMSEASGSAGEVGKPAIWADEIPGCCFQNTLIRVRPPRGTTKFLYFQLLYFALSGRFLDDAKGVGIHHLGSERLSKIEVRVAPLVEQNRIVAAIEQNLSDIDAGVASLERVLANLKRYRAAVLKAACEGRLVPTEAELARQEGREFEPGDVLLRRIIVERRARWEADQLAKMSAKGQAPRDERWKTGYEGPREPDISELPGLAEGWTWATVDQTIDIIDYRGRTPPFAPVGIAHLRSSNVRNGKIVWADLAYVSEDTYQRYMTRGLPRPGDLLFTTEAPLGEVAVAPVGVKFSIAQRMMLLRGNCAVWLPVFLKLQIMSDGVQAKLRFSATGSTVAGVSSRNFRPIALAVPPLAEQHRIVAEAERLLSVADEVEQTVRIQLTRAQRLRQSVLKSAFEGKLVPQDPNDEPASALLDRIRTARATASAANGSGRTSRRGRAKVVEADEGGLDNG